MLTCSIFNPETLIILFFIHVKGEMSTTLKSICGKFKGVSWSAVKWDGLVYERFHDTNNLVKSNPEYIMRKSSSIPEAASKWCFPFVYVFLWSVYMVIINLKGSKLKYTFTQIPSKQDKGEQDSIVLSIRTGIQQVSSLFLMKCSIYFNHQWCMDTLKHEGAVHWAVTHWQTEHDI